MNTTIPQLGWVQLLTLLCVLNQLACAEDEPPPSTPETLVALDGGARADVGVAEGGRPIYVRVLFHFENMTNLGPAADDVLAQIEIIDDLNLTGELALHRGEHQARWYELNRPDVIAAIRATDMDLGYHPHQIEPFISRSEELTNLGWDDALAGQRDIAGCSIEVLSGVLDAGCGPGDPGGIAKLRNIIDRDSAFVGLTSDGGINAVTTYVYSRDHGLAVQTTGSYQSFPSPDTQFFWYMGTLVVKGPAVNKEDWWATYDDIEPELSAFSGLETGFLTILGSDKLRAPGLQDWAIEAYDEGSTDLFDLYPPRCADEADCPEGGDDPAEADCWCVWEPPDLDGCMPNSTRGFASDECIAEYFVRFEQLLRDLRDHPRVEFISSSDVASLVWPASASLSDDQLSEAAAKLVQVYDRTAEGEPPRPPVEIEAGQRYISLTNLYEALLRALIRERDGGRVTSVTLARGEILGPPIDPRQCPARALPVVAIPVERLINQLDPNDQFIPVEVSLTVDGRDQVLGAAEILYLLAQAFLAPRIGRFGDLAVNRPAVQPCPRPTGAPFGDDDTLTAWEWHTAMQHWTTKRTDFRE